MAVYAVSSCCGVTLDSICDPHVYVDRHHHMVTDFYCSDRRCLAEAFGACIDQIFGHPELTLQNADHYADEDCRPSADEMNVYAPYPDQKVAAE